MGDDKIIKFTRDRLRGDEWDKMCYYLGLTGNYEGEPDSNHYKSIEVIIHKIEEA